MALPRSRLIRTLRVAGGFALLAAGVVLLVLPGPGIPLVAGGLVLIEPEFPWARRVRVTVAEQASRCRAAAASMIRRR
jgi:hypothetical protein